MEDSPPAPSPPGHSLPLAFPAPLDYPSTSGRLDALAHPFSDSESIGHFDNLEIDQFIGARRSERCRFAPAYLDYTQPGNPVIVR